MTDKLEAPQSIIWVVQEGNNDYAPAEEFGTVQFITKHDYSSMKECKLNDGIRHDISIFKRYYIQGVDKIVPAGNPITVALCIMQLGAGNHDFLKWNGRKGIYIPHTINAGDIR